MSTVLNRPATRDLTLYGVRWAAIFAGAAVGLSLHLLLSLLGLATGLAVYGTTGSADVVDGVLAAGLWNGATMLLAAFVGGMVAARASGLRRTGDGMLHGVVVWGATTLVAAIATGSVLGVALSGALGSLKAVVAPQTEAGNLSASQAAGMAADEVADLMGAGRRDDAIALAQQQLGISHDLASAVIDSLFAAPDAEERTNGQRFTERAATTNGIATWWLAGPIALSLLAGLMGGAAGTRSASHRQNPELTRHTSAEVTAT